MNDLKRNDRHDGGRSGGAKPMFSATCATCGKPCEVPFRPDGSRPIYCREHFSSKLSNPSSAGSFQPRHQTHSRPRYQAPAPVRTETPDPRIDELKRMIEKLSAKIDQALLHLAVTTATAGAKTVAVKRKKRTGKK